MATELCDSCKKKMPFAIMVRTPDTEWRYFRHHVIGKDAAYSEMRLARATSPNDTEWRVFPRNVADALVYGMKLGRSLATQKPPPRRRPLMALPEHI
jgi:hypothetical protein